MRRIPERGHRPPDLLRHAEQSSHPAVPKFELAEIIEQLKGISCHSHVWGDQGKILSCADAIAKALERYLYMRDKRQGTSGNEALCNELPADYKTSGVKSKGLMVRGACPICGGILTHEEGCVTCHSCGYSECS